MATPAETSKSKNPVQLLLKVVDSGTISQLKRVLELSNLNINGCNKHGEGALHIAAGYGKTEFVEALYNAGAILDCQDKNGDTPLYWAARHGHEDVVRFLCESRSVDINHQDILGETPALVATRYAQPDVLSLIIQYGADLNIQDKEGESPLLCACWHGHQLIVEQLLQANCSTSVRNMNGETALHVAAVRGFQSIVRLLCEHNAELNPVNEDGYTPLLLATKRNHLDIVQYLCDKHCDVNVQNMDGDTALHEACSEGQLSLVYTLCATTEAKLNIINKRGQTPVHLAAGKGHIEIVRYLCSSGCMLNILDKNGESPSDIAYRAGHSSLGDMLVVLRQGGMRERCLHELAQGKVRLSRVKLLFCGASGVGKSTLISSLRTKYMKPSRRLTPGGSYLGSSALDHTYGFSVQCASIPNAGEFSIWDFSGRKEYYCIHEFFVDCQNGIYIVLCKSTDPFEVQLAQVRFWLAMIKSKHSPNPFIHYAGHYNHKPFVVLVSSYSDIPTDRHISTSLSSGSGGFEDEEADFMTTSPLSPHLQHIKPTVHQSILDGSNPDTTLLQIAVEEFGDHFNFADSIFSLDTRQPRTREMKRLRILLGTLKDVVLDQQLWLPELLIILQDALPEWRKKCLYFPVITWNEFFTLVKEKVNPLVTEDVLETVAEGLMDIGEIIYIKEGHLKNIVILEVDWLGQRIFGPALAPEDSPITKIRSMTGRVPLGEIHRVFPELDPVSVMHLLEHFEICQPIGNEIAFEFPSLIQMEPLYGVWEKDPELTVYSGVRIQCTTVSSIFSSSLFPRIQLQIRKVFSDDIEDQELILWRDGLKCSRGEVEICVRQVIPNWSIEVIVRGTCDTRTECYALLQQFYSIILTTLHISNPSTVFTTEVLSMRSLLHHVQRPHLYSSMEIFDAERSDSGILTPSTDDPPETLCDLLCCGCKDGEITAKSAPYTSIRDIPLRTRVQLCRLLDPPDPLGRDWCLLALQLGLQDEVATIDATLNRGSPTDKLLTIWEYSNSSNTIVSLVDALRGIGRDDVAMEVVNGLSPFNNPNNSLVLNVDGVVSTSFIV